MSITRLLHIAQQDSRRILGLMSGTSLDGLDLALCHIKGSGKGTVLKVERFVTFPYTDAFRKDIQALFAKTRVSLPKLSAINVLIADTHAAMVKQALQNWNITTEEVDLLASHGQTIFHGPRALTGNLHYPNNTLQLGDGDHLAVKTGIITISDFRQKHVAAGGEGAPLVVYGDVLLFQHDIENRILLNIGGIANFTYLPANAQDVLATDVGPGNTLMNQYMQKYFNRPYDTDGKTSFSGQINNSLLKALLQHAFFELPFPKTTGPELFNLAYLAQAQSRSETKDIAPESVMATLAAFTAHAVAQAIRQIIPLGMPYKVYISGGGYHNPFLMQQLNQALPLGSCMPFDHLGLHPDAKEAALFALLANETIAGNASHMQGGRNAPAICLGKISLPY